MPDTLDGRQNDTCLQSGYLKVEKVENCKTNKWCDAYEKVKAFEVAYKEDMNVNVNLNFGQNGNISKFCQLDAMGAAVSSLDTVNNDESKMYDNSDYGEYDTAKDAPNTEHDKYGDPPDGRHDNTCRRNGLFRNIRNGR